MHPCNPLTHRTFHAFALAPACTLRWNHTVTHTHSRVARDSKLHSSARLRTCARTHARTQMSALRAHKGSHVLTALGLAITHSHTQSTHACTTHPSAHADPTPTPRR